MRPSGEGVAGDEAGDAADVAARKAALRRQLLQRRAVVSPAALTAVGSGLAVALQPVCAGVDAVAAYAGVGREPPTAPLLEALGGVRVLLPVLLPEGDLDWAEHRPGEPLATGPHGLLQPAGPRLGVGAVADCGVVLVPALAADRSGRRLGRGGGSYDRALVRARGLTVALVHDQELLDEVPTEPHDVSVDAVATPSGGVLRTGPRAHPAGWQP